MARVRVAVTLAAALCLAVGACTAPSPQPDPDRSAAPTPSPTPSESAPVVAELTAPAEPATVLDGPDPAALAVAVSAALYASAPVAVVAPADDVPAQVRAASLGVALGAPVLLATPTAAGATDPLTAELERLGVTAVLVVGAAAPVVPDGVTAVPAPEDPAALAEVVGALEAAPEVAPGGEVAAVATLTREAPVLLTAAPAVPADPAAEPDPTATPTPSPEDPADDDEATDGEAADGLPDTALADPLADTLVLTTGDVFDLAAVATARAAGADVVTAPSADPRREAAVVDAVAAAAPTTVIGLGPGFGDADALRWRAETAATGVHLPGGGQVLFPGRRMVALYGTPGTGALGLLGEQDLAGSIGRAQGLAAEYQALTGDVVVPAFEMIVTIASAGPGDDGNYSNELPLETFVPWIEAAHEAGIYVVLDLQPGRTDFLTQAQRYEPLLRYPNVGLALDPEWRLQPDQVHLRQIGSVGVDEVNAVGTWLADLTRDQRLPQKLFVLHQFSLGMISDRARLDTSRPELSVLIHADGQGSQPAKAGTWAALRNGAPAGVTWGWKNFIDEDLPMLTPAQTYGVQPLPELVTYQ